MHACRHKDHRMKYSKLDAEMLLKNYSTAGYFFKKKFMQIGYDFWLGVRELFRTFHAETGSLNGDLTKNY